MTTLRPLAAAFAAVLLLTPNMFSVHIQRTLDEARDWETHDAARASTSMRLEWYRLSLGMIAEHPIAGSGTGSFAKAYAQRASGRDVERTVNPHNEFLHIAVQLGAIGLAALLGLFYVQWRAAARLPSPVETHLARGMIIAFVIGCTFNSLLLDHTEGLFYVWLTGVLYGGLKYQPHRTPASAPA